MKNTQEFEKKIVEGDRLLERDILEDAFDKYEQGMVILASVRPAERGVQRVDDGVR